MAILWFLSCLVLLSEAYGESCRDTFLDPNTRYERNRVYHMKLWIGSTIHYCGLNIFLEPWYAIDPDRIVCRKNEHGILVDISETTIIELFRPITLPQEEPPVCIASRYDVFNNWDYCITTNLTYTCDSITSANNQEMTCQNSTEATSDNRQQVTVPILTNDECQKYWGTKSQEHEICTGLSSCMVDRGAGLLCKRDGTWMMAGIASSSCSKSKPAMFTHMSAFRSWLE